jgi:hypothetical protein
VGVFKGWECLHACDFESLTFQSRSYAKWTLSHYITRSKLKFIPGVVQKDEHSHDAIESISKSENIPSIYNAVNEGVV